MSASYYTIAMAGISPEERLKTLILFPEWGGEERVPRSFDISDVLRVRVREWNKVWQTVLDPVLKVEWPDPDVGRSWIAEGNALVHELQLEIGPSIRVVGDFGGYDPDGDARSGS